MLPNGLPHRASKATRPRRFGLFETVSGIFLSVWIVSDYLEIRYWGEYLPGFRVLHSVTAEGLVGAARGIYGGADV